MDTYIYSHTYNYTHIIRTVEVGDDSMELCLLHFSKELNFGNRKGGGGGLE